MKKYLLPTVTLAVLILCSLIFGCGPNPFVVKKTTDRFSDPAAPIKYCGVNNRLSTKSSVGGTHVDDKGLFIEPCVGRDPQTKRISTVFFVILHYGTPTLGFRPIQEIIFLTDTNDRIVLSVTGQDSDFKVYGWNNISGQFNTSYTESGVAGISERDMFKLSHAKYIEVKVIGGKRTQTYERDEISKSFLPNLLTFYTGYVANAPQ